MGGAVIRPNRQIFTEDWRDDDGELSVGATVYADETSVRLDVYGALDFELCMRPGNVCPTTISVMLPKELADLIRQACK